MFCQGLLHLTGLIFMDDYVLKLFYDPYLRVGFLELDSYLFTQVYWGRPTSEACSYQSLIHIGATPSLHSIASLGGQQFVRITGVFS